MFLIEWEQCLRARAAEDKCVKLSGALSSVLKQMSQIMILLHPLTFCPSLLAVECCHHPRLSLTEKAPLKFPFWAALWIIWWGVLNVWSRWPPNSSPGELCSFYHSWVMVEAPFWPSTLPQASVSPWKRIRVCWNCSESWYLEIMHIYMFRQKNRIAFI